MSGWTLGNVTLPVAPQTVTYKAPANFREITVVVEQPWLMSMGGGTPKLSLQGEVFEYGNRTDALHTSYIKPITDYTKLPQVVDEPLLGDVANSGTWHSVGMNTFHSDSNEKVKYNVSVGTRFGAGDKFYRDFDDNKTFLNTPNMVIWVKGDSAQAFKITFYNEVYSGATNGYRMYATAGNGSWNRSISSPSSANGSTVLSDVGTPTGWDKIRSIVVEPSGAYPTATNDYWFDAFYAAHAWQLTAPGSRYDGLYSIADVEWKERGGQVTSLEYKITLLDKTKFYGDA
jgi:hypothetical protein